MSIEEARKQARLCWRQDIKENPGAKIEYVYYDEEDFTLQKYGDPYKIEGAVPLGIQRDRHVNTIVLLDDKMVAALFTNDGSWSSVYTFDISVSATINPLYRHAIFKNLVAIALEVYDDWISSYYEGLPKSFYPKVDVHVVHPYAKRVLEAFGFKVIQTLPESFGVGRKGAWIMRWNKKKRKYKVVKNPTESFAGSIDELLYQVTRNVYKPITWDIYKTLGLEDFFDHVGTSDLKEFSYTQLRIPNTDKTGLIAQREDVLDKYNSFDIALKDVYGTKKYIDLIDYDRGVALVVKVG